MAARSFLLGFPIRTAAVTPASKSVGARTPRRGGAARAERGAARRTSDRHARRRYAATSADRDRHRWRQRKDVSGWRRASPRRLSRHNTPRAPGHRRHYITASYAAGDGPSTGAGRQVT